MDRHHIVGLFFVNENLTSDKHLQLLQQSIMLRLKQIFPNHENPNLSAESIRFQQDGASPHGIT